MAETREHTLTGTRGALCVHEWPRDEPRYLALLVHGYGEHAGRYAQVAGVLGAHGAAVFAPDHVGHGRSAGERVVVEDFEDVVSDVHAAADLARAAHPGLPLVMIGHSMGGLIAARYAQRYGSELTALVLSGPVIGEWELPGRLLSLPEIPDTPISPAALSRDPEVGAAYAADPLVWHGPMKRPTVEAFARTLRTVDEGGDVGALPVLWLHGDDDRLVPLPGSRTGVERLTGGADGDLTVRIYPGARHEVFAETDRDEVFADLTAFLDRVVPH
ncbi:MULTISPECIES: alpha/beta fold hydrolase [Streptomyces]|uniref:Alpha/beta hydrolase n=1 Tax=Streptomyces thermoviolaceus subsp. thermoviolaceus TaxID=66860 RepID=A0ABX0YLI1_STRTL|nr:MULTISPECIES: alpha/beta hydrolase [Streptomyces]MCM3266452.1 lysophospholipase [Streptomyces thermoviolaceus]NJP13377.1 alpha/beta hydrolase [Streptomyces thermoviolaceus subsp. thermoviolaceus]RSR98639.1 alpha/beta fold hydrolase [Streptomyces sp. WAC00469]WTD46453.1 lysophospholipase [Streptomyces thermoviolaceus]GGV66898.1 lysophospholipase [Streptomyces thermoviolaceus subsp. apingens]